ncbi:MAG TPA: RecQ family ATP-dependent DNA helicase [Flavobacteriales bacterium]|jgi:ATP-dependent DNA helicase RecQ|nr:RecQ family ATP-dependent DNA helicase [Flavobacteriales bacterium]HJN63523.1 RecQ family ATP-dependent DNA helicase [Flavobacteriales bacterium]|tara:strand:+ start:3434 stop:5338 length:1905 start_codon:yes stop_codon:yes gene_type:complete
MFNAKQILIKYWGHTNFRPMQEEIIQSVLAMKDTLALLPTGGGKSVCFQIPCLMQDGICVIISPLISLMKDQVEHLKSKGLKSVAITSGMSKNEVDVALGNCIYGNYKFLYLSPERLQNKMVQERIRQMNVNLITVDEAHCISEWGYDFRPSYLHIAEIREVIPNVPILALTATATDDIIDDIQEKLLFSEKHLLQSSFVRENLSYVVINTENKKTKLVKILNHFKSSAIVYVGSRKETKEITQLLRTHNISSDYYHAGLDMDIRNQKQEKWTHNEIRIMVATNAFGMGIDKENVRVVVHINTPTSLEAYFQEAGRAGRDGKLAYAILLTNKSDVIDLNRFVLSQFPSVQEIRDCYQKIADYFHIAVDTAEGESFEFDINDFCERYNLKTYKTYNILKYLEKEEFIKLTDSIHSPSKLHFIVDNTELYRFQVANVHYDSFIKLLLRSYSGLFENYVTINEQTLSSRFNSPPTQVVDLLEKLQQLEILKYLPRTNAPKLIFTKNRAEASTIRISEEILEKRKKLKKQKMESIIAYTENSTICRTQQLLEYFGEENNYKCGQCDVCVERNKLDISDLEFEKIKKYLQNILSEKAMISSEIINPITDVREEKVLKVLQWLLDNGKIKLTENKYSWIG